MSDDICPYCGADTSGRKGWITPRYEQNPPVIVGKVIMPGPVRYTDIRTCHSEACRARAGSASWRPG